MNEPWVIVPVKAFGVAKQRLAAVLDSDQRSRLGKAVASKTIAAFASAGGHVVVVTADRDVQVWATHLGRVVIPEQPDMFGSGLNGAIAAGRAAASTAGCRWLAVHADLPLIRPADARVCLDVLAATEHGVIVPSRDGGTNILGGASGVALEDIHFKYGAGSFFLHRRQLPLATVLVSPSLSIDLDSTTDLEAVRRHRNGMWIEAVIS